MFSVSNAALEMFLEETGGPGPLPGPRAWAGGKVGGWMACHVLVKDGHLGFIHTREPSLTEQPTR